jgi:hypothetical protein
MSGGLGWVAQIKSVMYLNPTRSEFDDAVPMACGRTPVNDLTDLITANRSCTIYDLNRALESLGWGIQVMVVTLFNEITSLIFSIDGTF